jgi:glycine cleavage system pyridoxal-binding protein P
MRYLTLILFATVLNNGELNGQSISNSETKTKRTSLAELYKLANPIKKTKQKVIAAPSTMWVEDEPVAKVKTKVEPRTMWIEEKENIDINIEKERGSIYLSRASSF